MSEAATLPSLMMKTSIVSEESLNCEGQTRRHTYLVSSMLTFSDFENKNETNVQAIQQAKPLFQREYNYRLKDQRKELMFSTHNC